jgi:hypothetical protein
MSHESSKPHSDKNVSASTMHIAKRTRLHEPATNLFLLGGS